MPLQRFNAITAALCYTNLNPPAFFYCFFDIRQMIDAFNNHMLEEYIAQWLNYLNK